VQSHHGVHHRAGLHLLIAQRLQSRHDVLRRVDEDLADEVRSRWRSDSDTSKNTPSQRRSPWYWLPACVERNGSRRFGHALLPVGSSP
jgi:hypothetical protein